MRKYIFILVALIFLLMGCGNAHQQANERIQLLYKQGNEYIDANHWDSAMIVFSKAERLLNRHTDLVMRGKIYARLGYLWDNNNNILKGIEYREKALQAYEEGGDENRIALTLLKIGDYYANLKTSENYEKAFNYIERAQRYQNVNDTTKGSILHYKGLVHFFADQWDSAIVCFNKAYAYPYRNSTLCVNRLYLGISHFKLGRLDSAKFYVKEAQKIPAGFRQRSGCCNMLHRIAKAEGDSVAAQHYASLLIAYKDSTMRLENAVSRQVVAIDSEADLVRDKQYQRQTAFIGGFIIVVLIVGCCVLRIRTRRHQKEKKLWQEEKQHTQKELQDEQIAHQHTREAHQAIRAEKIELRLQTLRFKYKPTQEHWKEQHWEVLIQDMQLNGDLFVHHLRSKHPEISSEDVRLCLLVLLNFSRQDIANTLNLAYNSIGAKKRRLATKMGVSIAALPSYLIDFFD